MSKPGMIWTHYLAGLVGGLMFGYGVVGLSYGMNLRASLFAVLGFLIIGWAVLDYRRFRRGTPESELEGGHTIE